MFGLVCDVSALLPLSLRMCPQKPTWGGLLSRGLEKISGLIRHYQLVLFKAQLGEPLLDILNSFFCFSLFFGGGGGTKP